jgi:predicted RNA-binding Zn-ribbon protein involved in translation (DUF1610 family)
MSVNTLGEAWRLGWRLRVRCFVHRRKKSGREGTWCDTSAELDMKTLVWTRGDRLPIDSLAGLFRCPKCGNRAIRVAFEVPNQPNAQAAE